jgi:NAD(P)-dependent dehydrogenase (short-subunit alcohol dehydrogenase family)
MARTSVNQLHAVEQRGEEMHQRLSGKIILVSGSTRGIGRSMAEYFASQGAKVAVTGRTVERGAKVVDAIKAAGGEADFFALDVTSEDSVKQVIADVVARFGGLTTLVNNAAPTDAVVQSIRPLHETTTEEWNYIMTGTCTGNVFWASKYAWPHLAKAEGASILNISSGQSMAGFKGYGVYGAAKSAVNSLTRTLAVEGAKDDIRANCIIVGRVVFGKTAPTRHAKGGGRLTRIGHPMDIAYLAAHLVSDEAAFTTGALMTADGGTSINGDIAADAAEEKLLSQA